MTKIFTWEELGSADLIVDAVYEGGAAGNVSDDPIAKLLPGAGNQGGFRAAGRGGKRSFVVLYTSGEDADWPDQLDIATGKFVYYGDNKTPGHPLHETVRGGNSILRECFECLHRDSASRGTIPPFFVFTKSPTRRSTRAVRFLGVAAPGFPGISMTEDLVAVWKASNGQRFQNYRATFTIFDVGIVERRWLKALLAGDGTTAAPVSWRTWSATGMYRPLNAQPTRVIRSLAEQTPDTALKGKLLRQVWAYFKDTPTSFESFAAQLYRLSDQRVIIDEVTRAVVDGGRDAVGRYLLGLTEDPVFVDFALEAKCYRPAMNGKGGSTVGVKEVARLISRLRHRQFGVLVTTGAVARQAYEEVRADRHPIVFISGRDIADILVRAGYNTPELVSHYLEAWRLDDDSAHTNTVESTHRPVPLPDVHT